MNSTGLFTVNDIADFADVTKAAVTNWRKRHADFPQPDPQSKPRRLLFNEDEAKRWLAGHGYSADENALGPSIKGRLNALRAREENRYEASLKALQLLVLASDSGSSSNTPERVRTWDALVKAQSSQLFTVKDHLSPRTGPLTVDEMAVYQLFAKSKDSAATLCEATLRHLLSDVPRSESFALGATETSSSQLLARSARTSLHASSYIYDPVCGIGEALIALCDEGENLDVTANDVNGTAASITALRLFLNGVVATVSASDVLRSDPHPDVRADVVIAEPPFNARPTAEFNRADGRWQQFWDPTGPHAADVALLLDALSHLADDGRAYVITSSNLLTARGLEKLRTQLVARGHVEALIELPLSNNTYSSAGTSLWVLRPSGADQTVLVDATEHPDAENHVPRLLEDIRDGKKPLMTHTIVATSDIATVSTHLRADTHLHRKPSAEEAELAWSNAANQLEEAMNLDESLGSFDRPLDVDDRPDFGPANMASLADLIRSGAIRTVNCHQRPKNASAHPWSREVLILPVGGHWNTEEDDDTSTNLAVPDDFDAGEGGDVIVPIMGAHQATHFQMKDLPFAVTSAGRVLRILDESVINADFLTHCINGDWNRATATSAGVPRRAMRDITIPLLDIDTQKAFVEYLERLDDFRQAATTAAERAERLISATVTAIRFGEAN